MPIYDSALFKPAIAIPSKQQDFSSVLWSTEFKVVQFIVARVEHTTVQICLEWSVNTHLGVHSLALRVSFTTVALA